MERSEILTEDWLLECWKERDNRTFNALEGDLIRTYRARPLHNLNLFFFGPSDETEQRHLHTLTIDNGKTNPFPTLFIDHISDIQVVLLPMKSPMQHILFFAMEWMQIHSLRLIHRTNVNIDNILSMFE